MPWLDPDPSRKHDRYRKCDQCGNRHWLSDPCPLARTDYIMSFAAAVAFLAMVAFVVLCVANELSRLL